MTSESRVSGSCSVVSDSVTPWIIQSMEFSRPEYWSGSPFPSPEDHPDPGIEPRSLHCRRILYQLSYQGSPVCIFIWIQNNIRPYLFLSRNLFTVYLGR